MPVEPHEERKYSLMEHLTELRHRLFKACLAILLTTMVAAFFCEEIFRWLLIPILKYLPEPKKLIVTSPIEQVVAYVKISILTGVFAAAPAILYQLWRFIAPGLYAKERRLIAPFIILGTFFFIGGAAFGFYVFLPLTFRFLIGMLPPEVMGLYTVEKYYSLVTMLLLAFGAIFELPLVLSLLSLAGVVTSKMLRRFRKYAIIVAFIISAVVTPTVDPINQTLMALPMIVFYELGIWFAWFTERRRQRARTAAAAA